MAAKRFLAILALLSSTLADITFTNPAAGTSLSGTTIDVEWTDSGSPALTTYSLFLCAGGNNANNFIQLAALKDGGDTSTGKITVTIQPGLGGSDTNAYFLKMISAATAGSLVSYSSRFTLSGMTGVFPAAVKAGLATISGTAGPANQDQTVSTPNQQGQVAAGADEYSVDYTLQTGPTRYAPMAPIPSTKITVKAASAQHPTSAWTPYKVAGAAPNAVKTVTNPQTFSVSSMEATIAPAAMPIDSDMQKFLNRWKD